MAAPKLFISYSWTTLEHEAFVLDLATRLRDSGVDVIFDKWDLGKGDDADAFMEKMVADPSINKVLMVVDRAYAEKSDKRERGVGTEAQIISRKVYEQQGQGKFVALSVEADENGRPYRPAYYASRILIDLTEPSRYEEKLEEVLRWVFDKPLYVKPPIGAVPAFLQADAPQRTPTSLRLNRTHDAVRENRANARSLIIEFFDDYLRGLETLRINAVDGELDDVVFASIDASLPLQKECISVIHAIARFSPDGAHVDLIQRLLEGVLMLHFPPLDVMQWTEKKADNFRFIGLELFLSVIAALLEYRRFDSAREIISARYFVGSDRVRRNRSDEILPAAEFRQHLDSFEHRKRRLKLNRVSLVADLLKTRSENGTPSFRQLMQADLVLCLNGVLNGEGYRDEWWPDTLIYADSYSAMEIFARAESAAFFEQVKPLLRIDSVESFKASIESMSAGGSQVLPAGHFRFLSLKTLVNFDRLATRP